MFDDLQTIKLTTDQRVAVRTARKSKKMSLRDVGSAASISQSMVAKIENGRGNASLAVLRRVLEAIDLAIEVQQTITLKRKEANNA